MSRRILVSWIGNNDLMAMGRDSSDDVKAAVSEVLRGRSLEGRGVGPLRTAIDLGGFDEVHLLTNYSHKLNAAYKKWLGRRVTLHEVVLVDPTEYGKIVEVVDGVMRELYRPDCDAEWC